jgi:hypothetical protein
MCLDIRIEGAGLDERQLRGIASAASDGGLSFAAHGAGLLGHHRPRLALHACELLSDDADWNAATWSMTPEGAQSLFQALARLFGLIGSDLSLEALWDGDTSEGERRLNRAELLDVVRRGALASKTRYLVHS